jgi:hypothetical protein
LEFFWNVLKLLAVWAEDVEDHLLDVLVQFRVVQFGDRGFWSRPT